MDRDIVYQIIDSERDFQDRFCKDQGIDPKKSIGEFLTLIRVFANKADHAWVGKNGYYAALEEIRKVAALCVACMEVNGAQTRNTNFTTFAQYQPSQQRQVDWVYLDSSNIDAVYYNEKQFYLLVRFHHGGIYKYEHVTKNMYEGLLQAKSAGKFFNANIKRNHNTKVTSLV